MSWGVPHSCSSTADREVRSVTPRSESRDRAATYSAVENISDRVVHAQTYESLLTSTHTSAPAQWSTPTEQSNLHSGSTVHNHVYQLESTLEAQQDATVLGADAIDSSSARLVDQTQPAMSVAYSSACEDHNMAANLTDDISNFNVHASGSSSDGSITDGAAGPQTARLAGAGMIWYHECQDM